jgi:hypothetical protein
MALEDMPDGARDEALEGLAARVERAATSSGDREKAMMLASTIREIDSTLR